MAEEVKDFEKEYSEEDFWDKLKKYAKVAGIAVIEKALQLYYALENPEIPPQYKMVIYGALVYFISPLDAIPDITPIIGYTDDLGVLAMAITTVHAYIDDDVKEKVKNKLAEWFD